MRIPVGDNTPSAPLDAVKLVIFKQCQDILRERLKLLPTMFQKLTGLSLHVLWPQPLEFSPAANHGSLCPSACNFLNADGPDAARCRVCLEQCWAWKSLRTGAARTFVGHCSVRNLCLGIRVLELCPVLLVVQIKAETINDESACTQAEILLQLLVHDLEATLQARLVQHELEAVRRQLEHLRMRQARFSVQPTAPRSAGAVKDGAFHAPGRHARQIVQAMLDYVQGHYQRPMALKEVAAYLGMNANYLSGLFHRSTGMTFHRYLHAVRMSKAEELLRDPRARVCDVATAVGYASPNHFRSAFKASERLSPTAWTEMQRAFSPQS